MDDARTGLASEAGMHIRDEAFSGDGRTGDAVVRIRGLGKRYRLYSNVRHQLVEWLTLNRLKLHRDFWALRGVDFELRPGDRLGVLGPNGSGKSTLLQLVAGILTPDEGTIELKGEVGALLELQAGFDPQFTGRENIFLAGQLRGISRKHMQGRLEGVIDFADIGEFIDQPVRTYSSGMFVRLAFSVATMMQPDILIVDEALSVGDVFFQHKCIRQIQELTSRGCILIFVTHSVDTVRSVCNRGLLLEEGRVAYLGTSEQAANIYLKHIREREAKLASVRQDGEAASAHEGARPSGRFPPADAFRSGDRLRAEITNVEVLDESGKRTDEFQTSSKMAVRIWVKTKQGFENMGASFIIRDAKGVDLMGTTSHHYGYTIERVEPGEVVNFTFEFPNMLRAGHYSLSCAVNYLPPGEIAPQSAMLIDQLDNVAIYRSVGLPDLDVYHRFYVPVEVSAGKTAASPDTGGLETSKGT